MTGNTLYREANGMPRRQGLGNHSSVSLGCDIIMHYLAIAQQVFSCKQEGKQELKLVTRMFNYTNNLGSGCKDALETQTKCHVQISLMGELITGKLDL